MPDMAETRRRMSSTLVAPLFSIWSRLMTLTGMAVSADRRLMDEPVTTMRSSDCCAGCCWAMAGSEQTPAQARASARRVVR
jgi:hypothetical protein